MKSTLVGYTGFVGGNLAASHTFDNLYNSKNIAEAYGANNGLVVYAGMPSEKFLANADPAADLAHAEAAAENIRRMKPEKLVLISTVDVYPRPRGVYEDTEPWGEGETAYGRNRLALETWARQEVPDALILRLPGLYGKGIKKNFIFDMLMLTPSVLSEARYKDLAEGRPLIAESYEPGKAGFYRLANGLPTERRAELRAFFEKNNFNALCFTDSRSVFQFYNLADLWRDLNSCLEKGLRLVNLATQPVRAGELYAALYGEPYENFLEKPPAIYDMRTRYGRDFGGMDDYIADRAEVVSGIARFAGEYTHETG